MLSRRQFLVAGAAAAACPGVAFAEPPGDKVCAVERLISGPTRAKLIDPGKSTAVWAYNGAVPGPVFRLKVGQRLNTVLENRLSGPTTVHWHGCSTTGASIPTNSMRLGRSYIIDFVNDTAFPHPVHLHGHPMKVLMNADRKPAQSLWRDTLLMAPRTRVTVALVADNPGNWMLHCHIPEHQEAGMMTVVSVT